MKVYKTNSGIIIEKEKKFWQLKDTGWDNFINDDGIFQKI